MQLPQEKQKYMYRFFPIHPHAVPHFFRLSPTGPIMHLFFCLKRISMSIPLVCYEKSLGKKMLQNLCAAAKKELKNACLNVTFSLPTLICKM